MSVCALWRSVTICLNDTNTLVFELDEAVLAQEHHLSTKRDAFADFIALFDNNPLVTNYFYWYERLEQLKRQWVVTTL
jgi:hypothetical protein